MSQDLEKVHTINLGKVLLSPNTHRATRAINMIREYARHHMKIEDIKIDEELASQIWKRGVRSPPRKIRVRMTKTDEGFVLVSPYEEETESAVEKSEKEAEQHEEKKESSAQIEPAKKELVEEPKSKEEIEKTSQDKAAKDSLQPEEKKEETTAKEPSEQKKTQEKSETK